MWLIVIGRIFWLGRKVRTNLLLCQCVGTLDDRRPWMKRPVRERERERERESEQTEVFFARFVKKTIDGIKSKDCGIIPRWGFAIDWYKLSIYGGGEQYIVGKVFANNLRDRGSNPGRVTPKTQKMFLDTSLLNTQHWEIRIKDKGNLE